MAGPNLITTDSGQVPPFLYILTHLHYAVSFEFLPEFWPEWDDTSLWFLPAFPYFIATINIDKKGSWTFF